MADKFEKMAEKIYFSGGNVFELLNEFGLELKEGKTSSDVIDSFRRGINYGSGKFEREMLEAGIALQSVCRVAVR